MSYESLKGIRVVDFGIITAGAGTSAMLADLGAEVIKIEGPQYIDPFRVWTGVANAEKWWDTSAQYAFTNRNKRNLCVDLKQKAGLELVHELVASSDIVVENFRAGVMDRLGLGFDALAAVNPSLIMASISSQGATGPYAQSVSFGSTLEASGGLSALIRSETGQPLISGHALNYPDQIVSLTAVSAILCALFDCEQGKPVWLDISQREVTSYMLGEFVAASESRAFHESRDEDAATGPGAPAILNTALRCADDVWIAVTVADEEAWGRIASRLQLQSHALSDAAKLTAALEDRLRTQPAGAALRLLTACGASAEIVRTAATLIGAEEEFAKSAAFAVDPQGSAVKGLPWRCGDAAMTVRRAAPALGADNHYITRELLGRSEAEYQALLEQGVLTDTPRE
jgi:benzylsuccinate CoA-transferase BbsF subunit